jgi:hypothetical protein
MSTSVDAHQRAGGFVMATDCLQQLLFNSSLQAIKPVAKKILIFADKKTNNLTLNEVKEKTITLLVGT